MPEPLNVFEHQRFRLRRWNADGSITRFTKSFREIVTGEDDACALDYPQEFFNVAALNLLAYLAQAAFEPETIADLAACAAAPLSEADFDTALARGDLRRRFALTGEGPRFMQGPAPEDDKKAEPLSVAVFVAPKGDRQFLFRADAGWAVTPEQAGLFLFARNTFYEGTGGRGYQKGTNGDTPVRTLVVVPAGGDALHLRQSLWLNVLAREAQRSYPGDFAGLGTGAYDGLFWGQPPVRDVPVGGITLRAGLGWMTAFHWLHFEESDRTWTCPVTGEPVTGLVASRATKRSTGIAYGTKGDLDAGQRADRLFRHPNVPTRKYLNKKTGDYENEQPFQVDRLTGVVDALGAAFFGAHAHDPGQSAIAAPAVSQLHADDLGRWARQARLLVFGFHMLSAQKNVHGGYERDTFAFHPLGRDERETRELGRMAREQMEAAADFAGEVARALQLAVQRTAGAGVRAKQQEDGSIKLEKPERLGSYDNPFGRDVLADFWRAVQAQMGTLADEIARAATGGPAALLQERPALQAGWEDALVRFPDGLAWRLYHPVFEHYSTLTRTMPYAHAARRIFGKTLVEIRKVKQTEDA